MKPSRTGLQRILRTSPFPLTFLLRNFRILRKEPHWRTLSIAARRGLLLALVKERVRFFMEVRQWVREKQGGGDRLHIAPGDPPLFQDQYCNRCGACCEFASGLPDFPFPGEIPVHWLDVFGEGLGRGHRFCPFLWEDRAGRRSICSIHPWRPVPCRSFEEEECAYLKEDPAFQESSPESDLSVARRWLVHLVDPRKTPGRLADLPAKSPKFLKLNRV